MKRIVLGIGSLLVLTWTTQQGRAETEVPPSGGGELRSLSALPATVLLRGADQVQQLVITGHYANGGVRDLTRQVTFRAVDPSVVRVSAGGLVEAGNKGVTEVVAAWQGQGSACATPQEDGWDLRGARGQRVCAWAQGEGAAVTP